MQIKLLATPLMLALCTTCLAQSEYTFTRADCNLLPPVHGRMILPDDDRYDDPGVIDCLPIGKRMWASYFVGHLDINCYSGFSEAQARWEKLALSPLNQPLLVEQDFVERQLGRVIRVFRGTKNGTTFYHATLCSIQFDQFVVYTNSGYTIESLGDQPETLTAYPVDREAAIEIARNLEAAAITLLKHKITGVKSNPKVNTVTKSATANDTDNEKNKKTRQAAIITAIALVLGGTAVRTAVTIANAKSGTNVTEQEVQAALDSIQNAKVPPESTAAIQKQLEDAADKNDKLSTEIAVPTHKSVDLERLADALQEDESMRDTSAYEAAGRQDLTTRLIKGFMEACRQDKLRKKEEARKKKIAEEKLRRAIEKNMKQLEKTAISADDAMIPPVRPEMPLIRFGNDRFYIDIRPPKRKGRPKPRFPRIPEGPLVFSKKDLLPLTPRVDHRHPLGVSDIVIALKKVGSGTNAERVRDIVYASKQIRSAGYAATSFRVLTGITKSLMESGFTVQGKLLAGQEAMQQMMVPDPVSFSEQLINQGPLNMYYDQLDSVRGVVPGPSNRTSFFKPYPESRAQVLRQLKETKVADEKRILTNILKFFNSLGGTNVTIKP